MVERFEDMRGRCYSWLIRHKFIASAPMHSMYFNLNHRALAQMALAELDPAAKRAVIPTLIQMLGDKNHKPDEISEVAGSAFLALSKMAPESIDPLIATLTNKEFQVWALASGALGRIGPDAKAAIPVLKKWLTDKDPNKRINAAEVIGELGGGPREFLPVVIKSLPELNRDGLLCSLDILVRYKEHSMDAVPVLKRILSNISASTNLNDIVDRNQLEWTLNEIDPKAAAKEGIN